MREQDPGKGTPRRRRRLRRLAVVLLWLLLLLVFAELIDRALGALRSGSPGTEPAIFELFVVGGSSAEGLPYEPLNMGVIVAEMFGGRVGERTIVVRRIALSGESTYSQAMALRVALRGRDEDVPGAVLIYAGHNERISPGPEGADAGGALAGAERLLFRHTRLYSRALFAARRALNRPPPYSLAQYEFFLGELVDMSRDAGLEPILSTVSGNIGGIEPGPSQVDRAEEAEVGEVRARLDGLEAAGRWEESLRVCEEALAGRLAGSALIAYWRGLALQALGRYAEADDAFWEIIDQDPGETFRRATRSQNALVPRVAEAHGARFVDGLARLREHAPNGIIGNELFADGHHGMLEAYLIVAEGFAEAVSEVTGVPIVRRFADEDEFFAATEWEARPEHGLSPAAWLIAVSAYHTRPERRMQLAEERVRSALALAPNDYRAWILLGVAQGARRAGLLRDDEVVRALGDWGFFYRSDFDRSRERVATLLGYLERFGADAEVIESVRRNYPEPAPHQ
jgi:tetratricopeptide (TPR) repeat protein